MSKNKYRAQPLSREEIRAYAKHIRSKLMLNGIERIDVIWLLEHVLPKAFGDSNFHYEIIPKNELGQAHGLTDPSAGIIRIREDVYEGACNGIGRDRYTIVHEIGHYLLHDGIQLGLARVDENEQVPTYCNPEWQADAFAGEFLMDYDIIRNMTPDQIAERCGVSLSAARYQKSKCAHQNKKQRMLLQ